MTHSIAWDGRRLEIIDQTELPERLTVIELTTVEEVWRAIRELKVRGAPAIGVAAAYGLVVAMRRHGSLDPRAFLAELRKNADYLNSARPTAVNLGWAVRRVVTAVEAAASGDGADTAAVLDSVTREAEAIHREDIALCKTIGEHGAALITEGCGVLTHCNAGRLATSEFGTATAPMYLAHSRGVNFRVYSDETRPLLQGSRLTAWELQEAGIDVVTITDNAAAHIMQAGNIDLVIVGTDRVAANGDVANKIGTLGVAILAAHFDIPFYVACPSSTVDMETETGGAIPIEERGENEVTHFGMRRTAPVGIAVRNPAFDVTPHNLVTGLITDRGIISAPYRENLARLF